MSDSTKSIRGCGKGKDGIKLGSAVRSRKMLVEVSAHSLVNALESALDSEVVLELDSDLLPCEGLECREDELSSVEMRVECKPRCSRRGRLCRCQSFVLTSAFNSAGAR